jgi:phosphotransferase system  glucose/maltose/N-acetylglucosamine-specific IIC component
MLRATIAAISPDFTAVGGGKLQTAIGALLTLALIAAVASLIVSAISWGIGNSGGNHQLATKGKTGVIVAVIGAALTGSAVAYLNWLIRIGGRM